MAERVVPIALSGGDLALVLNALGSRPFAEVETVIEKLRKQINSFSEMHNNMEESKKVKKAKREVAKND